MASETSICNSALTRIGAARITSLTDDSKQARACTASYALMRDEVLRSHPWNSAISRASVASLADAPAFGYDNQFQLPGDCLRILEVYDSRLPWVVEGRRLLCDETSPVSIRYVRREEDPNQWDPLLQSAVASRLALELVEELTQSSTKRKHAMDEYRQVMGQARTADGREQSPMTFEEDEWVTVRL